MTILLDTCTVVDVLRGTRPQFRARIGEALEAGRRLAISSLVLYELTYGAMISAKPEVELAMIDGFVAHAHVEPWSAEDGLAAARARTDLKKIGLRIGAMDILIGGQALNRGWSLVTENIREFVRIDGLNIIDWSDPAGARAIDRTSWLAAFRNLKDPK